MTRFIEEVGHLVFHEALLQKRIKLHSLSPGVALYADCPFRQLRLNVFPGITYLILTQKNACPLLCQRVAQKEKKKSNFKGKEMREFAGAKMTQKRDTCVFPKGGV